MNQSAVNYLARSPRCLGPLVFPYFGWGGLRWVFFLGPWPLVVGVACICAAVQ